MKRSALACVMALVLVVIGIGCPAGVPLPVGKGGDPQIVGAWSGTAEMPDLTAHCVASFDQNGGYMLVISVSGQEMIIQGTYDADPTAGWIDRYQEKTIPATQGARGTLRGLYTLSDNSLQIHNNPIDMARPLNADQAAAHFYLAR